MLVQLSLIQKEIDAGIHPHRIVLAGYSQGGSVALNTVLSAGVRLGGVAALSMFQPSRLGRLCRYVKSAAVCVSACCTKPFTRCRSAILEEEFYTVEVPDDEACMKCG